MSGPKAIDPNLVEPLQQTASRSVKRPAASENPEDEKLRQACRDFEEIFLRMVLKEAKIDRSLTGGNGASPLYGDLIRENFAKALARGGGMGLAETLYQQLSTHERIEKNPERNIEPTSSQSEGQE